MKINLPPIPEKPFERNAVEKILLSLKDEIEGKYNSKILVLILTSTNINEKNENVLSYALYLSFVNRNKFSYRLFELNCINPNGDLPVEVIAFSAPPVSEGIAYTKEELEAKIEKIFDLERTRNIILSNYNL